MKVRPDFMNTVTCTTFMQPNIYDQQTTIRELRL